MSAKLLLLSLPVVTVLAFSPAASAAERVEKTGKRSAAAKWSLFNISSWSEAFSRISQRNARSGAPLIAPRFRTSPLAQTQPVPVASTSRAEKDTPAQDPRPPQAEAGDRRVKTTNPIIILLVPKPVVSNP